MRSFGGAKSLLLLVLLTGLASGAPAAEEKHAYTVNGTFVEGCSCSIPCTCEIIGPKHGCQGMITMAIQSGSYMGVSLAGAKIAVATAPGNWARFYVDAKNSRQQEALTEFAKVALAGLGKLEAVKKAPIEITGKDGRYRVSVDGGKIAQLTTEPVLGGDKKNPVSYSNVFNPLSPTVLQGKTVGGSYHDGERSFSLHDSNSYFNGNARGSGKV